MAVFFFFFNDTATTEIYTLSLHDALPICGRSLRSNHMNGSRYAPLVVLLSAVLVTACGSDHEPAHTDAAISADAAVAVDRSEEHTSELQSRQYLVCRLLLEKKKKVTMTHS